MLRLLAARNPIRFAGVFFLCSVCLFLSSCSSGRKPVYPVRGQVFDAHHKPAAGALVVFNPTDQSDNDPNKPRAYVEEDGSFQLTTYEESDGAPAGDYVVTIIWKSKGTSPFDPSRQGPDKLGGRYSKVADSKLRFTIDKRDNVLPPIQVE
jgi:hypothetical protein